MEITGKWKKSDSGLLKENTHSFKKDAKALLVACKEVGLAVNSEQNNVFSCFVNIQCRKREDIKYIEIV